VLHITEFTLFRWTIFVLRRILDHLKITLDGSQHGVLINWGALFLGCCLGTTGCNCLNDLILVVIKYTVWIIQVFRDKALSGGTFLDHGAG
jgi:hypothetical protein